MPDFLKRVILVDPATPNREHVRQLIVGMDSVLLEAEFAHYDAALEAFGESPPEGLIVSLDGQPAQALQLIGRVLADHPQTLVIALSSKPDQLVQAYRLGAKLLLDNPVKAEDLLVALRNLSAGISLQRPPKGKVVALLPSRGGIGCTSLAVNLGCTLAADADRQVVLLDLDFITGAADVALDLVPEYRLGDLAGGLDKIDLQSLRNALTRDDSGLVLLARPARCQEIALITADHIQRILSLLRITFSHIIIDLSKGWLASDVRAMELADTILFVTEPELGSIRNAVMLLASLTDGGLANKVRVVMNRVGADFGGESIDLAKAQEVMGRPIAWQLPNDYKSAMAAWNAGGPLIRVAPRSRLQQAIAQLAAELFARQDRGKGGPGKQTMVP